MAVVDRLENCCRPQFVRVQLELVSSPWLKKVFVCFGGGEKKREEKKEEEEKKKERKKNDVVFQQWY